ncbi:MAG: NAD(P)-dependent oxidoreductase [Acidobacteriota bacterium]|nr:NAD(P)-dependent oxidoreductase [Blastocatellia bacterium]MDW8411744.1 NAD(P)-dependent oxidoreductase [Acidobacteriota bacterium]
MKTLVTGGSGYLGTHVRQYFNADDFSRRSGLDLLDEAAVSKVADYDLIIHMAALIDKRPEAAEEVFKVNVTGTINLLRQLRKNQTFIFCSTKDVYGSNADKHEVITEDCSTAYCGQDPYSWSKLIAEHYVMFYGHQSQARTAIFRLSTVYAPDTPGNSGGFVSHFVKAIREGKELVLKMQGQQVRDLLYVDDLSRAIESFFNSHHQTGLYNIGGGKTNALTLKELAELIARAYKVAANVRLLDTPVKEQIRYITDTSRLQHELGWRPTVSIEEGIKLLSRSK